MPFVVECSFPHSVVHRYPLLRQFNDMLPLRVKFITESASVIENGLESELELTGSIVKSDREKSVIFPD